ncbi:hypothetical protein ACHQM5_007445 [Ranunculus cassubicifolius]
MARLAIIGALIVFLLALAEASVFQTVITTEVSEPNPHDARRCQSQLSRMRMESCLRYLQSHMIFIRMDMSQMQQQCCQELQDVNLECRCEALRETVERCSGSPGAQHEGQMQEIIRKAEQIPSMCEIQPQHCEIHEPKPHHTQKCQRQLGRRTMDSCMSYLQPQMLFTRMDMRPTQEQCCQELQDVNPECRCEAIEQTVERYTSSQGGEPQQMQEVMKKAKQLPHMCGLQPESCDIQQDEY